MFCILAILLEVVIHIIAHTNEGSALRICIVSIDKEYFLAYIIMQIKIWEMQMVLPVKQVPEQVTYSDIAVHG